jgi:hypothetical protein
MNHGSSILPPERKTAIDAPRAVELRLHAAKGLNLAKSMSDDASTPYRLTFFEQVGQVSYCK